MADTPENDIKDFSEGMDEEHASNLKSAMPGIERALAFMRRRNVEEMEQLPLEADAQVRVARGQIRAIDDLLADLRQFATTGEKAVGERVRQRVGRPGRR